MIDLDVTSTKKTDEQVMGFFFDGSIYRTVRQSIQNCIPFSRKIKDPWNGIQIKDKAIRVML